MKFARPTRRFSVVTGVIVVVVVIALAAVFVWPGLGGSSAPDVAGTGGSEASTAPSSPTGSGSTAPGTASSSATVNEPAVPIPDPQIVPMTPSDTPPTDDGVTDMIDAVTSKKLSFTALTGDNEGETLARPMADLMTGLVGIIIDPVTGETLWSQQADEPRIPASTMKVLTAVALLTWADPDERLVTTVVKGDEPGQIVLVGGGDVTLSAVSDGAPLFMSGGPKVADLARQIEDAGVDATSIVVDTSYWSGDDFAQGWLESDRQGGYLANMSPLMVDEARSNPAQQYSPRSRTPAKQAGAALATALGQPDLPVTKGEAPDGAEVIASVESQPLATLLAKALQQSDNTLSDALARQAAIAMGAPPSFGGVKIAITQALVELGIDPTGLVVEDGSGMSTLDRVPTRVLGEVMSAVVGDDHPQLRLLLTGLPLAGVTGTLAEYDRYTQPLTEGGRGWVRAKTGTLQNGQTTYYALTGYVPDVDGRLLAFAFNSKNPGGNGYRYAMDALATGLRSCGCSE